MNEDSFSARGICVHFDGVKAVDGVDLEIRRGEILGLVGPNGAGKTTLVNALTGFEKPTYGECSIGDRDVLGKPPHAMASVGVARTFQAGRLFNHLTVLENIEVAALKRYRLRRHAEQWAIEVVESLKLGAIRDRLAGELSHGEARTVELGRAIALKPEFLLLDEPAAGLNESESDRLVGVIAEIPRQGGCGVLIIEHDMKVIMRLCDRIHVLDHGKSLAEGTPEEIRGNAAVTEAYLGGTVMPDA
ncbi:MAG: ABC transporter ATP-binding protein [Solirubrobacterales bacterium]|nr:ABC transporter ATP-binding protein [Solirubrobacterales bacterium]